MITTVVFDLDDTLYDEIEYCRSGFRAVASHLADRGSGISAGEVFEILWGQFTSGNRTRTFNSALERLGIRPEAQAVRQLVELYRGHTPEIRLPSDSREVLEALRGSYSLGLLTDGYLPAQQLKVEALGIEDYFKSIVYTEQLGRDCWKPSTAGFEKLIADLQARPESMAYVGDNETKDFIAPNRLGMLSVQVLRPGRMHTGESSDRGAKATLRIGEIGRLVGLLADR